MNVAIILAGPYRGSGENLESHKNFVGNYDMYVSCFEHYITDWNNSEWKPKELYTTPKIDITQTNWYKYRNDAAGQSGFWQFWNLKSVIDNVPKEYDFYIKSRSDLRIQSKLDIDFNSLDSKTLYMSGHSFHKGYWDAEEWVNDEFYIGSEYVMNVISKFADSYYETHKHPENEPIQSNERSLYFHLKENGISFSKINNFTYSKNHNGNSLPAGYSAFQLENITKNDA